MACYFANVLRESARFVAPSEFPGGVLDMDSPINMAPKSGPFIPVTDIPVGNGTAIKNLQEAIASGDLIRSPDSELKISLKNSGASEAWLFLNNHGEKKLPCTFRFKVLFSLVYDRQQVPQACASCYKVKVVPGNLKQLMALRELARAIPCLSKFGSEINHRLSQNLWGGYFYCDGLEHAREIYRHLRDAMDQDPALGSDVPMRIKRGCTEYEVHCGPSDQWTFKDQQPELEKYLFERFQKLEGAHRLDDFTILMQWIETAYSIGDDSYLEFTGGRRLYQETVSYAP